MGINLGQIRKENLLSVDVLELGLELDGKLRFPTLELGDSGGRLIAEEDSSSRNNCEEDCNLLSVHVYIYIFLLFLSALIKPSRIYHLSAKII